MLGGGLAQYSTGLGIECRVQLTIPGSVTLIEGYAFSDYVGLKGVFLTGDAPSPGAYVFYNAPNVVVYHLPGTQGWGETFAGRPTAIWFLPDPAIIGNTLAVTAKGFAFLISWATNSSVVIAATPNLEIPSWSPLSTNLLTGGTTVFIDPAPPTNSARFYRVLPAP